MDYALIGLFLIAICIRWAAVEIAYRQTRHQLGDERVVNLALLEQLFLERRYVISPGPVTQPETPNAKTALRQISHLVSTVPRKLLYRKAFFESPVAPSPLAVRLNFRGQPPG